jgi:hypothetical protein
MSSVLVISQFLIGTFFVLSLIASLFSDDDCSYKPYADRKTLGTKFFDKWKND